MNEFPKYGRTDKYRNTNKTQNGRVYDNKINSDSGSDKAKQSMLDKAKQRMSIIDNKINSDSGSDKAKQSMLDKAKQRMSIEINNQLFKELNIDDENQRLYLDLYDEYLKLESDLLSLNENYEFEEIFLEVNKILQNHYPNISNPTLHIDIESARHKSPKGMVNDFLFSFIGFIIDKAGREHGLDEKTAWKFLTRKKDTRRGEYKAHKELENTKDAEVEANKLGKELITINNLYEEINGMDNIDPFENADMIEQMLSHLNQNTRKSLSGMINTDFTIETGDISDVKYYIWARLNGETVQTKNDLDELKGAFNGKKNKYSETVKNYYENEYEMMVEMHKDFIPSYLAGRYRAAQEVAEIKKSYGEKPIILDNEQNSDSNGPSGLSIASNVLEGNLQTLNKYKIPKHDISDEDDIRLRYSAFNITFNNIFNQNDPFVQKLVSLNIDLRSELSNYGIYNYQNKNAPINEDALKKFISDRVPGNKDFHDNIEKHLLEMVNDLRNKVNENYDTLCGNFYTDQEGLETIAKTYALGEIIENIKKLFSRINTGNLGKLMGFELNKENPADIVGDCLFLRGKLNGTDINIKYDLSSGKLFMNSFVKKSFNPDKINIGNTQPNTQIGTIDSFDSILEGYDFDSIIQPAENSNEMENVGYQPNPEDEPDPSQITPKMLEGLTKNKLFFNLQQIGKFAGKEVEIQAQKNSAITNFLRTFNVLPNKFNPDFEKESNIFDALQIIDNSDTKDIEYFNNKFMPLFMDYCGLLWGEDNSDGCKRSKTNGDRYGFAPDTNRYDFTFNENNEAEDEDAYFIRKYAKAFDMNPDKLKGKGNYNADYQLGFADFIKSDKISAGNKLNQSSMEDFINNLEDKKDLKRMAMELGNLYEDVNVA